MPITDYSTTAASNTAVGGVNIQGTAPASGMDNALRAIMADIATALVAGTFSATGFVSKSAGYTVAATDRGKLITCTTTLELELPAAATAGAGFMFYVKAKDGAVTLDPNGTENINGSSTSQVVPDGSTVLVVCDGAGWQTGFNGLATLISPAFLTSFSVSGSASGVMQTMTSTAAGSATYGPVIRTDRDATAGANNLGGAWEARFRDASGNALEAFATQTAAVPTATHGAEVGAWVWATMLAGTHAGRWVMSGGFYKFGGTDPGAGLIAADGFQFPSSVALSSNANTLDDYEEGTFTPAFTSSGATFSYSTRNGEYRKVGKLVFYSVELALNTSGNTVTGNPVTITGLPFACNTAALTYQAANVLWNASTASYIGILAGVGNSSTAITITGNTAAAQGNAVALNSNALLHATLGSAVRVSGFYSTDS